MLPKLNATRAISFYKKQHLKIILKTGAIDKLLFFYVNKYQT